MSIFNRLQGRLNESSVEVEEIQKDKLYRLGDGEKVEFVENKDVEDGIAYDIFLTDEDGKMKVGVVYKIEDGDWKARADKMDVEFDGYTMVDATVKLLKTEV